MHHAEVVTLRQDTSSESGDETLRLAKMGIPPPMQSLPHFSPPPLISPQFQSLGCQEDPFTQQLEELRQRHIMEQQQLEREFEEKRKRLAEEELRLAASIPTPIPFQPQPQLQGNFFSPTHHGKPHIPNKFNSKNNYQLLQKPLIRAHQPQANQFLGSERSFDDQSPVINSDDALPITQPDYASTPAKKKNFLSQFFKKPTPSPPKPKKNGSNKKSKKQKNCENINNSYKDDEEDEEEDADPNKSPLDTSMNKSSTASELKLSTLERSPHRLSPSTPRTNPYDRPWMAKNESMVTHPGSSLEQTLGSMSDFADVESSQNTQQARKLSMSKPTNIDDIDEGVKKLQPIQKSLDQRKVQTADDVFRNDPWFQKEMQSKLPMLNLQMTDDSTQEIDLDEELENGGNYEDNEPLTCRQIEEIIWPKSEHESDEDDESMEAMPTQPKPGINFKAAFLKLGDMNISKKIDLGTKRKSQENKPVPDPVEFEDQEIVMNENKVPKDESSGHKKIGFVGILKRPSWKISKNVKKAPVEETKTDYLDDSNLVEDREAVDREPIEMSQIENQQEVPEIVEVVQHEQHVEEPESEQEPEPEPEPEVFDQEDVEETLVDDENSPPSQQKFSTSFKQRMSFRLKKGFKKTEASEKEAVGEHPDFSPTSAFNKIREKLTKKDVSHESPESHQEQSPKPSLNDMLQQKLHLQRPIFKIKSKKLHEDDENETPVEGQNGEDHEDEEIKDLQEVSEQKLKGGPSPRPFFRIKSLQAKKDKKDSNEEHLVKEAEKEEEKTKPSPPKMKSPKKDDSKKQPPGKFFRTPSWKGPSSSKKSPKETSPDSKLDKSFESNKSTTNLEENDNLPTIEVYESPPKSRFDLPEEDTSSPMNPDSAQTSETDCQEELSATPDNMDLQGQQEIVEAEESGHGIQVVVDEVEQSEEVEICEDLNNVTLTDDQIQESLVSFVPPVVAEEGEEYVDDDEPVTVVVFPVERNEPGATEKEKSFKKGFAGLFKVNLMTREKLTNEEPGLNEEKDLELGEEENHETGNAFSGRRMPITKAGLSGLFASKRKSKSKPELQKTNVVQDNDETSSRDEIVQEKEEPLPPQPAFQRRQPGSALGNLFGSMRAARAKSVGSLADKVRSANNPTEEQDKSMGKKRSQPDLKEPQSPPRQAMKSARKLVSMFSKSTDGHEKPIMGSNLSDSDVEYTEEPYRRRPNPNVAFQNSPEPDAEDKGASQSSPEPPEEEEEKPTQFMPQRQAVSPGRVAISRPTVPPPPPLSPTRQQNSVQLPSPPQVQTRPVDVGEDQGGSNRQMGRRSGRFRKSNETNAGTS